MFGKSMFVTLKHEKSPKRIPLPSGGYSSEPVLAESLAALSAWSCCRLAARTLGKFGIRLRHNQRVRTSEPRHHIEAGAAQIGANRLQPRSASLYVACICQEGAQLSLPWSPGETLTRVLSLHIFFPLPCSSHCPMKI